jgi:hypothetical protein
MDDELREWLRFAYHLGSEPNDREADPGCEGPPRCRSRRRPQRDWPRAVLIVDEFGGRLPS